MEWGWSEDGVMVRPAAHFSVSVGEALDNAWAPVAAGVATLTDAAYWWQPVPDCWTVSEVDGAWLADWSDPDPDPAPLTTIAWRCWHIAVDCLDSYSVPLFGRGGTGHSGRSWVGSAAEAGDLLVRAWEVFRTGVGGWDDAELLRPLGPAWGSFAEHGRVDLALHAAREVVHHGAEISLLRDLHRHRMATSIAATDPTQAGPEK
jgi:hypothetical protein